MGPFFINTCEWPNIMTDLDKPFIGDMEKLLPQKISRPWGWYENLYSNRTYKVKRLCVDPGKSISLQRHFHRNEQWVVVKGSGTIYLSDCPGGKETTVSDVHHIGIEEIHRLRGGRDGILIVEVQYGDMCIEEDIERLEDDYGRV